jgi:nucleoside-diphosphate-sugar epimerase
MRKNVLVIGGTRYFGRALVEKLLVAGHRVTLATRGLARDSFGDRVARVHVDRRDPAAMSVFAAARYDVVYDQVCYTPADAHIAATSLGGRVGRYVMASTIEVYDRLRGSIARPLREDDVDVAACAGPVDDYGSGKRQAEAVLAGAAMPVVRVRIGHVLGGLDDFTGRLASYLPMVQAGAPFRYTSADGVSSFLNVDEIARFLTWAGDASFTGPINAACDGPLSALDLHQRAAHVLGRRPNAVLAPAAESPFDYAAPYVMDTGRARSLGYTFTHSADWIDGVIAQHVAGAAAGAGQPE